MTSAIAALARRRLESLMPREFLYRRLGSAVIVILLLAIFAVPREVAQGTPQLKRPQQDEEKRPEDKKPKKKVKGPRAVGLLQLNSSGKGSLIPIAILVDGKFYDASVYKADPTPMALESGTVYEVEQTGSSQGLFTISAALHTRDTGSPHPWMGAGSYLPNGTEVAQTTRKAEDVPVGLESTNADDGPPRLTRGSATKPAGVSSNSSPAPAPSAGTGTTEKAGATAPPVASSPTSGSSGSGPGQAAPKPATPASDKSADQGAKDQPPKAAQTVPGQESSAEAPPTQVASSHTSKTPTSKNQSAEDSYRPTLRRGKPTQSAPEDPPAIIASVAAGSTGPLQLVPAISDEGGPEPRSYKFFWKTGEEEERRNQMLALAGDGVRGYADALAKNRIPANPPATKAKAAMHKTPAKPVQPIFENIQFRALDVWGNNQALMILSADAHFPPAPGATTAPESYNITLVTRTDIYGSLRKVYSGVTDKFHLDVTPKLELIDAVDADGDGRGELLFRETTDAGDGYVIYRPTADKLWKLFDSLAEKW